MCSSFHNSKNFFSIYLVIQTGVCTLRAAQGEMADGWYGEWTDWRDENEQQASKEPPTKYIVATQRLSRGVVTGDVEHTNCLSAPYPTATHPNS